MARAPLAVAAIALLTGCGSSEPAPSVSEAAAKTVNQGSSRFEVTGIEGSERIRVTCTGEADYDDERLRMGCDYGASGMELVVIGTDAYLRGDVLGLSGASAQWAKVTNGEAFADDLDPHRLLAMVQGASQSSERVGEEAVRGVDTVRYRLVVDCDDVELGDCEGETMPVDVWIDDDDLVRRVAAEEATAPFAIEFFDFGVGVDVEAPPADEVVDLDGWFEPTRCRPGAGEPLTGNDVVAAFRSAGFVARHRDDCVGGLIAHVFAIPGREGDGGVVQCSVVPTVASAESRSAPAGMTVRRVGNVLCLAPGGFPSAAAAAFAALERQARQ